MAEITLSQIAALLAALGFLVLVYFSIKPLRKLSGVLDRLTESLRELTEHTLPAIDEAAQTVAEANAQVKKLDCCSDLRRYFSNDHACHLNGRCPLLGRTQGRISIA
ncbi:hypothetical protein J2S70_000013 [Trueperella bonasi]|uniref:Uncharacterized protein n=1 Tax=Trueperella bonasi TaxID=312286 RepID=A0ABT9NDG2_9ACTO|nr:DUF948 domain-containing protein [Trueperella bonasi]MDP9805431.1 hypothetical protein [Trueperella bonasi]